MNSENPLDDLFPMPLTSMEKFHRYDSSAAFNNQVYCRFRYRGIVDAEAGQRAVDFCVSRHPLFSAQVREQAGRLKWVQSSELMPTIDWHETLNGKQGRVAIKDSDATPWKIVCRNDGRDSEVWFCMSHAIADGLGGIQVACDWMKCYHERMSEEKLVKRAPRLNPRDLLRRNSLGLTDRSYLKKLWKQPIALFGASKFIFRRPAELFEPIEGEVWNDEIQPAVIGVWIDAEPADAIRQQAKTISVSVNALLVGELMRTLKEVCLRNPKRNSEWVRVILPMNIRNFADRRMPATNRATVVQVDRRMRDCQREDFFGGLNYEIQIIRDWELGKLFLLAVKMMNWIPGALRRSAKSTKCRGTAVFANLSEPFGRLGLPVDNGETIVGNLRLREFDFVGPIRLRMPLNFTFQEHLGRMRLSLHYDSRVVDRTTAEEILGDFAGRLAAKST